MSFPIHPSTLTLLEHAYVSIVAPPPKPRGLLEFCRSLKVCVRDEETGEDRWETFDPTGHPAQFEVLQAFRAGECDEMVVLGPVQDGKTYALIVCCLLYCLIELRQSAGLMLPEQEKAEEIWLEKIVPVIVNSGYQWILPTEGRGSKAGAARFIQLQTGATVYLIGAGAKNESAQSSFTVRFMFLDEASAIRPHLIQASRKRTASYDRHGRNSRTTTIKHDVGDSTVQAYDDSTGHTNWFQCPHCALSNHLTAGWQPFDFDLPAAGDKPAVEYGRLHYDPDTDTTARDTASLVCLHDHTHLITNAQRRDALRHHRHVAVGQSVNAHGQVIGNPLPNSRKGIRWNSMESPIKSLGKLAVELRKALIARDRHNDHAPLRQFRRDECVRIYTGDLLVDDDGIPTALTRNHLVQISAASTYTIHVRQKDDGGDSIYITTKPEGPAFLVSAVDVQRGGKKAPPRLYFEIDACDLQQRTWVVGWGHVVFCPAGRQATEQEVHAGLDRFNEILAQLAGEFNLPIARRGVDVGDQQDEIRRWLKLHPEWWAIKGASSSKTTDNNFDLAGWIYRREQHDPDGRAWWMYFVDDDARRAAQDGFLMPPGTQGSAHLPQGLDGTKALVRHYCSTIEIPDGKGGRRWSTSETDRGHHPEWSTRDDFLACRTYLRAMLHAYVVGVGGTRTQKTVSATEWFKKR